MSKTLRKLLPLLLASFNWHCPHVILDSDKLILGNFRPVFLTEHMGSFYETDYVRVL